MRKWMMGAVSAGALAAGVWPARRAFARSGRGRRWVRRTGDGAARSIRHWTGRWQGVSYRLRGRRPDPDVPDLVLADRVRSTLGPLERHLDLPHIHVMAEDHTVLLHGDVDSYAHIEALEDAVARVPGVVGVESYLHLGLLRGDTRPSAGKATPVVSLSRARLLAAARAAGVAPEQAPVAVRAVLGSLAERIPPEERSQVMAHLPADVKTLMAPPRRAGASFRKVRTLPEFIASVVSADGMSPAAAPEVVASVLQALKALIPEEATDVAAVLPADLRQLWASVAPRVGVPTGPADELVPPPAEPHHESLTRFTRRRRSEGGDMDPRQSDPLAEPTAAERGESPTVEVRVLRDGRLVHVARCESEDEAAGVAAQWEDLEGVEVLIEDMSERHGGEEILQAGPPEPDAEEVRPQQPHPRWRG